MIIDKTDIPNNLTMYSSTHSAGNLTNTKTQKTYNIHIPVETGKVSFRFEDLAIAEKYFDYFLYVKSVISGRTESIAEKYPEIFL